MATFKPTAEQEAITKAFLEGHNLMVQAYAGCAKTTSQVYTAKRYTEAFGNRRKKLAVAFNVRAKKELEERLAGYDDWDVKTFNGLGHSVLLANPKQFHGGRLNVLVYKNAKLIDMAFNKLSDMKRTITPGALRALTKKERERLMETGMVPYCDEMMDFILKSVDACKIWGIRPGAYTQTDMSEKMLTEETSFEVAFQDSDVLSSVPEQTINRLVNAVLDESLRQARYEGIIDYNDQIYLSTLYCENKGRQWPVGLVDEVQDTSKLNIIQIERALSGQVCFVGDRFQNRYKFRGSYDGNMEDLQKDWNAKSMTLGKTFRCPVEVVTRSRHLIGVDDFHAMNKQNKGAVQQPFVSRVVKDTFSWSFDDIVRAHMARRRIRPDHRTAILCRTNKDCVVVFGLLLLSEALQKDNFEAKEIGWSSNPIQFNAAARKMPAMRFLEKILPRHTEGGVPFTSMLEDLKDPDPNDTNYGFVVSTVHRCKGLEYDDVYIFNADSLLSDTNVNYVAQTRTKKRLAFLHLQAMQQPTDDKSTLEALTECYKTWDGHFGLTEQEVTTLWFADKAILLSGGIRNSKLEGVIAKQLKEARKQAGTHQNGSFGTTLCLAPLKHWKSVMPDPAKAEVSPTAPVEPAPEALKKQASDDSFEKLFETLLT